MRNLLFLSRPTSPQTQTRNFAFFSAQQNQYPNNSRFIQILRYFHSSMRHQCGSIEDRFLPSNELTIICVLDTYSATFRCLINLYVVVTKEKGYCLQQRRFWLSLSLRSPHQCLGLGLSAATRRNRYLTGAAPLTQIFRNSLYSCPNIP